MNSNLDFEDLVETFLERCRNGNAPALNEFAAQHPAHAQQLLDLLPLLQDMETLGGNGARKAKAHDIFFPDLAGSDYRLLRKLGSGGMGVVFEALQISLNRKVAVKLLAPNLVADAKQRERFEQEARVIALLHHPNIVKVLSAGSSADSCYYAMELIDGKGLDRCEFRDPREIAGLALQAASALAYAHSCNVMHRDIKPANLLLGPDHEVHVSDFGLAFVLDRNNGIEVIESTDSQSGTLRYMAPERLSQGINSFLSDQYSLGVTLYELIARSPLLPERDPKKLIEKICEGAIPPLRCGDPDLAAIVTKSIRLNPADRYPSLGDLAEDIRHYLNREPVKAAPASPCRRVSLWARRTPAVAALSLASGICALAFVAALLTGYVRTAAALTLAEKNAAIADATLSSVFIHLENQVPSPRGTRLLSALMPYYQGIAEQRNSSPEKIAEANTVIGTYALRAGNYPLAEKAFRRSSEFRADAFPLNQLADALRRQGKASEADALSRQVVSRFADSEHRADRFEVVRALEALSSDPESAELAEAFQILKSLLQLAPENPEYRFQYAVILGDNPRLFRTARVQGVEPNAVALLNELAREYPGRPEYGLALVGLMNRRLRYATRFKSRDWSDLSIALALSDQLLGSFPNTPEIVSSIVQLREIYAETLRKNGDVTGARRETERLLGALEMLFFSPEVPDTAKESLIQLQFQRLELAIRDGRTNEAYRASSDIRNKLQHYRGSRQLEFKRRLDEQPVSNDG